MTAGAHFLSAGFLFSTLRVSLPPGTDEKWKEDGF
jgi:hypothetical protein